MCPTRQPLVLSKQTSSAAWPDSFPKPLRCGFPSNSAAPVHGNGNGPAGGSENKVFFQNTVIEFGTPHEVLFVVDRPLEFADRVLVESNDGSLRAEASVVAVQYHPESDGGCRPLPQTGSQLDCEIMTASNELPNLHPSLHSKIRERRSRALQPIYSALVREFVIELPPAR
jgi:hypothetical protein